MVPVRASITEMRASAPLPAPWMYRTSVVALAGDGFAEADGDGSARGVATCAAQPATRKASARLITRAGRYGISLTVQRLPACGSLLLRRDRLVDDVRTRPHDAKVCSSVIEQRAGRHSALDLPALVEQGRVAADEIAQRDEILVGRRRPQTHLRAFREAIAQAALVETARGFVAQEHHAAAHAGADPTTRVPEHNRAPAGHVFEREAAKVAAEQHLRAREADAGTRVRAALHVETSALCTVAEALPDRAVDEVAVRVARHGRVPERRGELGDDRAGDALAGELTRGRRCDEPMLAAEPRALRLVTSVRLHERSTRRGEHAKLATAAAHRTRRSEKTRKI